jgi:hypothetical protein
MFKLILISLLSALVLLGTGCQSSTKESELFSTLQLIYEDDFDGEFNPQFWQKRTKNWQVKDGVLTGAPDFKTKEEAMKKLKRNHHLGLGPVIRLEKIPAKFVCELRFKYTGEQVTESRPKIDFGHHIMNLFLKDGGYNLRLPESESFLNTESSFKLNHWNDLKVQFKPGKMIIDLNGNRQVFEHEKVNLKERKEFTFKSLDGGSLMVDSVKLWEGLK